MLIHNILAPPNLFQGEWDLKIPPIDMLNAAKAVLPNAYAPYSHFAVAACVRTEEGKLFSGCNVENAAFPLTLCAEANAIGSLYSHGYQKVSELLVLVADSQICPPCGACRQRLLECASPDTRIHLCTMTDNYESYTLSELLPIAFGPKNLEKAQ